MDIFSRVIYYDPNKDIQVRVTVSEFYEGEYISIREYYMGFEGEWLPGSKGVTLPLTLEVAASLFTAFCELISEAESEELIAKIIHRE